MWKTNYRYVPVLLATAMLLTACGSSGKKSGEVLLYEGEVESASGSAVSGSAAAAEEQYETTVVKKGDYKETFSESGELEYTDIDGIYIHEEDAMLDSIKVKKDQKIKKGDIVAYYHVDTSKTKLEKEKLEVSQARANYEAELSRQNSYLSQLQNEYKNSVDSAQKKMKALEIKKQKQSIAAFKKTEKEVKDKEKAYSELVRVQKKTPLRAPKSGVVVSTAREHIGDEIEGSLEIIQIRNNDKWLLSVKDPDAQLRYNMDVDVCLGENMNKIKDRIKGKVMTASDITGVQQMDEEGENIVYIEISKADRKKYDFEHSNIYIQAVTFEIKDSLLVSADAVYQESSDISNKLYVQVLENGSLHKRYIVSSYKTDKEYLVDQGVNEGQTLAIVVEG